MSYETGIILDDYAAREAVSKWYADRGDDFEARYAMDEGFVGTLCGYGFYEMSRDIANSSIATKRSDEGEYEIIPLTALTAYTYPYRAFSKTTAGKRLEACIELDVPVSIGDRTSDEYDPGNVYISPEDMIEAKRALQSTGKGGILWPLVEEGLIIQLDELSELVEFLEGAGVTEVGWTV